MVPKGSGKQVEPTACSIRNLQPSITMAFIKKQGKTKLMSLPVTTSTAITEGALVAFVSGLLVAATNTTAPSAIAGVLVKGIAATDADFATARSVAVEVPVEKNVVWEAPVSVGTLATTSVGAFFDLGTDDAGTSVDQSATTYDVVQCVKFLSTTKGWFVLNIGADGIAGK